MYKYIYVCVCVCVCVCVYMHAEENKEQNLQAILKTKWLTGYRYLTVNLHKRKK